MVDQQKLTPEMLEGCIICSVQMVQGIPPMIVIEIENRKEQRLILQIIPVVSPQMGGNVLLINSGITLNLNPKP